MLDDDILNFSKLYIGDSYVKRCIERRSHTKNKFTDVITNKRLPETGFSESDIEGFLLQLSSFDSNNWNNNVGVGEREGRVLVDFIHRRHYGKTSKHLGMLYFILMSIAETRELTTSSKSILMASVSGLTHGIGRSGDVTAIQPKAPGSSLINRLTNELLLDWLKKSGCPSTKHCFLVPMATGMSLSLCLLALKKRRPKAQFVIWPRIDQKSCFKCILTVGLIPIPIEPILDGDQLCTNLGAIHEALINPARYLIENRPDVAKFYDLSASSSTCEDVLCVLSTTNCFAPRIPDKIHAITKECVDYGVSHLINNAYGVQSPRCMRMLEAVGNLLLKSKEMNTAPSPSIDLLYVQSTDKNLLVPVGGAIVAGFSTELVNYVAKLYPGRASATPTIDTLATLLKLGSRGWSDLVEQQSKHFQLLRDGLVELSKKHKLQLMHTPANPISFALDLTSLYSTYNSSHVTPDRAQPSHDHHSCNDRLIEEITQIGSSLFTQGCSGIRVVLPALFQPSVTKLDLFEFRGFNSHSSKSERIYLNCASALGQSAQEIDLFLARLDRCLERFRQRQIKKTDVTTSTNHTLPDLEQIDRTSTVIN